MLKSFKAGARAGLRWLGPDRAGRSAAPEPIHFLHIGKTAGTQIKHLSGEINRSATHLQIVSHPHARTLSKLPAGERYFFSIRSPERRFYSGFYSRKRKGAPRHFREWTSHEAATFRDFAHANDLADALSEPGAQGRRAVQAITSLIHTASMQIDWFDREGYFLEHRPPVHIVRQEAFAEDFARLGAKLDLDVVPVPSDDAAVAHRNSYGDAPPLSARAKANLAHWYHADYRFYELCEDWLSGN